MFSVVLVKQQCDTARKPRGRRAASVMATEYLPPRGHSTYLTCRTGHVTST